MQVEALAASSIAATVDLACIAGNGVGKPLGIITAPGTITVSKETSQIADTLVSANLAKMLSRLNAGSYTRAIWLCHPTAVPQLFTLMHTVRNVAGTENVGGAAVAGWFQMSASGEMSLLGRPLIVHEACSPIGDLGDLILMDPAEYVLPMRNGIRVQQDLGPLWTSDQTSIRVILRVGGQPIIPTPVKIDASNTTSSFVVLEAR